MGISWTQPSGNTSGISFKGSRKKRLQGSLIASSNFSSIIISIFAAAQPLSLGLMVLLIMHLTNRWTLGMQSELHLSDLKVNVWYSVRIWILNHISFEGWIWNACVHYIIFPFLKDSFHYLHGLPMWKEMVSNSDKD